MDSARLTTMLEFIQEQHIRMHSILVVRNGHLVLEAYFNPYQASDHHQIASITKSVIGALVGIAIQQGKIKSLQERVVDFFPDREIANLDARKKAMTLEHLLMLAPGLDCADPQGTEADMVQSKDWVQFVLDLPMVAEPGEKWTYCSSAVHLVSAILQKSMGEDARSFANRNLFAPIGIAEVPPERWPTDPSGVSMGGAGLQLTPSEIARFAYLILKQGRWQDQQVIPESWVAASLIPHISVGKMKAYGDMERSYGYLWSLYPEQGFFSALGRNGQHIHVFPDEDLLVVFTSATPVATDERQFALLKDYILPSVRSDAPIPENPQGLAELEALVQSSSLPRIPIADLPEIAHRLNGKTIRVRDNPSGWEEMTLFFENGADTAEVRFDNGDRISIGLDNIYRLQEVPGIGKFGYRGAWVRPDRFTVQQVFLGGWNEVEIEVSFKDNQVVLFQRDVVDGGNLVRIEGQIEE
jgi:CubicO group peptidase (beta-lactamase class C family)